MFTSMNRPTAAGRRLRLEIITKKALSLLHQCLAALGICWPAGPSGTSKLGLPDLYGHIGTCTMSQPASLNHGLAIHLILASSIPCAWTLLSCPAASKKDKTGELTADGPDTEEESHSSGEDSEEDSEEDDGMIASREAKQAAGRRHLG